MMNKDGYTDWLREKLNAAYNAGFADGRHAIFATDSEEYEYMRNTSINLLLKDAKS